MFFNALAEGMVAKDRYKRSHGQENDSNSVTYTGSGLLLIVRFLVTVPFSRETQIRIASGFARSLALAHHEGRTSIPRKRPKRR